MAERKTSSDIISSTQQGGLVRNVLNQLKLIFRLMGDSRVSFLAKIIPVGTLIYLISPVDAISIPIIGALDDAALLWLGSYVFTELCPPDVVQEHLDSLTGVKRDPDDVVDAEATEIKE